MISIAQLTDLWSTTRFPVGELSRYAEQRMVEETRRGVVTMSAVFLALLLGSVLVHEQLGLGAAYLYTAGALAALCAHVGVSARVVRDVRTLNVLGMTLLIVSGSAFVLVAQRHGSYGASLFTNAVMLFMVVPMVPWGLREASIVTLLIYLVFSSSTWTVAGRFDPQTLWALQTVMFAAGAVSLTLVARGTHVRREELQSRFELEQTHREVERLSRQDPLTGVWNRRHLEAEFDTCSERVRKTGTPLYFALIDVDRFKQLNDGFGHTFGDQVLVWVGEAFRTHLCDSGFVARVGGDEFALLFGCDDVPSLIEAVVATIRARVQAERPGEASEVSLSIGVVELPRGRALTSGEAYMVADGALYRAKRSGAPTAGGARIATAVLGAGEAGEGG